MTVKELIDKLQTVPQDAEIFPVDDFYGDPIFFRDEVELEPVAVYRDRNNRTKLNIVLIKFH